MIKFFIYFSIVILTIFVFIFRRAIIRLPLLIYWIGRDMILKDKEMFPYYGCWFFVGKQGSGKSIAIVELLERLRKKYPKIKIYSNMGYTGETAPLQSLNDLMNGAFYNGIYGTVFVIDEIQNEFAASTSANFPETILSVVTQQRKQRILILCSSQVFTRVAKPLREQAFKVIECRTYFGRYTTCKYYDGVEYSDTFDYSDDTKFSKRPRIDYHSFVQSDKLRDCYDSYALIERLSRVGFKTKIT